MNKFEAIVNLVNSLMNDIKGFDEAVRLHNAVAYEDYGKEFYYMSELDDACDGLTYTELANKIHWGDFNPMHRFFRFNDDEQLESANFPTEWIDVEAIAEWCVQSDDSLYNEEIAAILEQ